MTEYKQEPSLYWVEDGRQGDPTTPRWFQGADGHLYPVTRERSLIG